MITFAIPTWNRADSLKRCVESMLAQNPDAIVICDNASTDNTQEVCMKLADLNSCIKYVRYEDHVPFPDSYKRAVMNVDGDGYTWTFGDDDLLVETALSFVKGVIKTTNFDFYHVAETTRIGKGEAMAGTVLGLCSTIGFLDYLGFISGNIGKTCLMKKGVSSPNYELFSTSSYPQALSILESMAQSHSMMIELGCVESAGVTTEDTAKRWGEEQTCWKYLFIGNGLKKMHQEGTIPSKVPEVFFRYLEENMFTRMMRDFNGRAVLTPNDLMESDWECFLSMAEMVDGERGYEIATWIKNVKKQSEADKEIYLAQIEAYKRLSQVSETIKMPVYPLPYLPEGEEA